MAEYEVTIAKVEFETHRVKGCDITEAAAYALEQFGSSEVRKIVSIRDLAIDAEDLPCNFEPEPDDGEIVEEDEEPEPDDRGYKAHMAANLRQRNAFIPEDPFASERTDIPPDVHDRIREERRGV